MFEDTCSMEYFLLIVLYVVCIVITVFFHCLLRELWSLWSWNHDLILYQGASSTGSSQSGNFPDWACFGFCSLISWTPYEVMFCWILASKFPSAKLSDILLEKKIYYTLNVWRLLRLKSHRLLFITTFKALWQQPLNSCQKKYYIPQLK